MIILLIMIGPKLSLKKCINNFDHEKNHPAFSCILLSDLATNACAQPHGSEARRDAAVLPERGFTQRRKGACVQDSFYSQGIHKSFRTRPELTQESE